MTALAAVVVLGRNGLPRDVVVQLLATEGREMVDLDALSDDQFSPVVVLVEPTEEHWRQAEQIGGGVVLVANRAAESDQLVDLLERGADAVLDTNASFDEVLLAIDVVAGGGALLPPEQARIVLERLRDHTPGAAEPIHLTKRERDILASIGRGESVKQTARALENTEKTVQNIQSHLFRKLGARNRAQAIARAHELGLIEGVHSTEQ